MSDTPTCRTCPWILYGVLWPQCNNPRAIRDGYQVDPGADSCDGHPGRVLKQAISEDDHGHRISQANQSEEHVVSWSKGRTTDTYRADAVDAEIAEKDARIAELEAENLKLKDEVGDEWARAEQAIERIAELEAENKRLLDRITQLRQYRDQMLDLTHRAEQAEAERDQANTSAIAQRRSLEAITEGQLKTITRMNEACVRAEAALAERGREIRKLHWMFTHGSSQISQRELSDQYDLEEKTQHPRTDKANAEFYGGTCARAEEGSEDA